MKKLLLILISIIALSSCYVDVKDSVIDSKKETTAELQKLPKDTVVISIDEHVLYVFDDNNQVVYKTISTEKDNFPIHPLLFIALIILSSFIGILIVTK